MPGREHDVSALISPQLERARRDLETSFALTFPGSPVRVTVAEHLSAVERELSGRTRLAPAVVIMQMASKPTPMPCHYPACRIVINGTEQCDEGRNCR
jgi:hypothetical protein